MEDILKAQWKSYPAIRLLPILSVGILLPAFYSCKTTYLMLTGVCCILLFTLRTKPGRNTIMVLMLLLAVSLNKHQPAIAEEELHHHGLVEITAPPKESRRSVQVNIRFPDMHGFKHLLVYLEKTPLALGLKQGDLLMAELSAHPLTTDALPGNFDYSKYLLRKGITHRTYLKAENWQSVRTNKHSLMQKHGAMQVRLSGIMNDYLTPEVKGLMMAMVLGIRNELDPEHRQTFGRSGVMHILAVSGLHVSIIWLLVAQLHKPLTNRLPQFKPLGLLLELAAVWLFAWFTGFGPSVQRAAFMFSLFSLAHSLGWQRISLNITAGSALILLLINPRLIAEPGFQLSYAAVFGILLFFPIFNRLLSPRNAVTRYLWSLQCVSLAAVLGTAPLSMYYFQQLPLLFPVSNCIAVPAAFILVGSCPIFLLLADIPIIAFSLGKLISWVGIALIHSMGLIAECSFGVWNGIYLDRMEMVAGYLILLLCYRWISFPKYRLQSMVLILVVISISQGLHTMKKVKEYDQFEFYVANDHTLLVQVGNRQSVILRPGYKEAFATDLSGNRKYHRIRQVDSMSVDENLFRDYQLLAIRASNRTHPEWLDIPGSVHLE